MNPSDHLLLHFTANGDVRARRVPMVVVEEGEGVWIRDSAGKRYFDGLSGLFCAQLGYSYGEEVSVAIGAQLRRLACTTNYGTAHPTAFELADKLIELTENRFSQAFFVSGGSEAVEAAWKIARQYHHAHGQPRRTKAIARRDAYHGVTLGALSLTGIDSNRVPFGPPAIDTVHVSNTDPAHHKTSDPVLLTAALLAEMEREILRADPETVALIALEPIQNVGGCLPPPVGYWQGVRALADRYGILVLADEVISGCGRLGRWLGGDRFDAVADLVTMAKGLAAGYAPMGAVLVNDRVAAPLLAPGATLQHGTTFGGNPLSCAAALASIAIVEREDIHAHVRNLEAHLEQQMRRLMSLDAVRDVRGGGFFWAAELHDPHGTDATGRRKMLTDLQRSMLAAGVLVRLDDRAGRPILQIAPPLISSAAELNILVDRIGDVLARSAKHQLHAAESRQRPFTTVRGSI